MAKINSTNLVISLSKLVKDNDPTEPVLNDETKAQLEVILTELSGPGVLVEIQLNLDTLVINFVYILSL